METMHLTRARCHNDGHDNLFITKAKETIVRDSIAGIITEQKGNTQCMMRSHKTLLKLPPLDDTTYQQEDPKQS